MGSEIYNMENYKMFNRANSSKASVVAQSSSLQANSANNKNNLKSDCVVLFGKEVKKKKLAIATLAVLTVALSAFAYKKKADISKFASELKYKLTLPEKIELPPSAKYDLTKEADTLYYDTYNTAAGFSGFFVNDNGILKSDEADEILKKISHSGNYFEVGKTKEGIAYVKCHQVPGPDSELLPKRLETINLISKSQNFTPAQKNLIALMHQGKFSSENSPLDKIAQEVLGEQPVRENIFDAIGKWAQDIDIEDKSTQKLLKRVSNFKNGQKSTIKNIAMGNTPVNSK